MSREFKKTFFTSLMAVLLVISNLICYKLTNFFDLTISMSFITYPFTFLCTLLIYNMGGKKSAYGAVIVAVLIQAFIIVSYSLTVNIGTQAAIPDMASHINEVFKINETDLLASIVSFLASQYLLIYVYDNFKTYKKEFSGVVLGLLGALFLDNLIYKIATLYDHELSYVVNNLLSGIIISLVMVVIITIIYYILKEKDIETVEITDMNINVNKYKTNDLAIEDVILNQKEEKKTPSKKTTSRSNAQRNNYSHSKNSKANGQKRSNVKSKKTSKTTTKKQDN